MPPERADRVLVNLHGGGFVSDSGSMLESIPIASLTRTKVVTVPEATEALELMARFFDEQLGR